MNYVGKYKIISLIGEGGMANVYLVEDERHNHFALKEMKPEFLSDPIKRKRFSLESNVIKNFNHPSIIKIIKSTYKERIYYNRKKHETLIYVMEYIKYKSLKEFLVNNMLTYEEKLGLFVDIFDALYYCHKNNIIHRDLKCANILLKKVGNKFKPVISDFGVAKIKARDLKQALSLTREITILGAPHYMSPEQFIDPSKIDPRSDLYSAGVMLYEVMTGEKPFKGTTNDLKVQHMNSIPTPPSKLNAKIDKKLEELILQLLEKRPSRRPQNAAEAREKLRESYTFTIDKTLFDSYQNSFFYRTIFITQLSLINRGKKIYSKNFTKYPLIIGANTNKKNKFFIKGHFRRVKDNHCEILKGENGLLIRDSSNIGTVVNQKKLVNDILDLDAEKLYRIVLPEKVFLELFFYREKEINPITVILLFIVLVVLIVLV